MSHTEQKQRMGTHEKSHTEQKQRMGAMTGYEATGVQSELLKLQELVGGYHELLDLLRDRLHTLLRVAQQDDNFGVDKLVATDNSMLTEEVADLRRLMQAGNTRLHTLLHAIDL